MGTPLQLYTPRTAVLFRGAQNWHILLVWLLM